MAALRRAVLVSGANKGIGLGIVERLLATTDDVHVLLCSRSIENGQNAVRQAIRSVLDRSGVGSFKFLQIVRENCSPALVLLQLQATKQAIEQRIDVVKLDVSSDASVEEATC